MNVPKVSVVIPTYNRADLLSQSIRSVLAQTYGDFELIVVDDGSTDHTEQMVKSHQDHRIVYVKQANQERCVARNNGISRAAGDVIAFLDDDDLWFPDTLAAQIAVLDQHPEVGLVYSRWVRVDTDNLFPYPLDFACQTDGEIVRGMHDELLVENPIPTPTVAVRKRYIEEAGGFDPSFNLAEDWDLWIRVSALCNFCEVPRPLAACRVHSGNSVGDSRGILDCELAVLQKHLGPASTCGQPEMFARGKMLALARRAAQALSGGVPADARSWLSEANALAVSIGLTDQLRDAVIASCLSDSLCTRCDLTYRAGLIRACAVAVAGREDAGICRDWQGSYWLACSHSAYALGDYSLCLWCIRHLISKSVSKAVRRGTLSIASRSLAGIKGKAGVESAAKARQRTLQEYAVSLAQHPVLQI